MGRVPIIKLIWLIEATCQAAKLISKNPERGGGGRSFSAKRFIENNFDVKCVICFHD